VIVGVIPAGPLNSITDVTGVQVGHTTLIKGDDVRTGVTAVLPHGGNLFREKVPGAVFVGNGFGKLAGSTQVNELGEIESPILLTSTLSVPRVADAVLDYMLALPGNEDVRSLNPLVAETNDGGLNDIRGRHVTRDDVISAIRNSKSGAVEEGSVGAGTGTIAFGFKGGIGTSSRRLPDSVGGYTVGVLVQSNFGGVLTIAGAPVGRELGRYYLKEELDPSRRPSNVNQPNQKTSLYGRPSVAAPESQATPPGKQTKLNPTSSDSPDGSVIIVIATDAPLDSRNLNRLAARSMMGLARTGSSASNGSGDYAIAFSTAASGRIRASANQAATRQVEVLRNDAMSPLFLAVIEATEEAVYNSLFRATDITGRGRKVEALPLDRTFTILRKYGVLPQGK
jgi:D-aminopeptidase